MYHEASLFLSLAFSFILLLCQRDVSQCIYSNWLTIQWVTLLTGQLLPPAPSVVSTQLVQKLKDHMSYQIDQFLLNKLSIVMIIIILCSDTS